MPRTDSPRHGLDSLAATSSGFAVTESHPGQGDRSPVTHGDLAEGVTPGWEAAWIDLGGEG
ncbi:MAG TPA: hypothetical protein VG013_30740 [Gemmataceae bacterium]|jgi:hypothetical protein|nr:hypothetical protein [Gemmataceae bacterium]